MRYLLVSLSVVLLSGLAGIAGLSPAMAQNCTPAPTYTPYPTYTRYPTYTPYPTYTRYPTYTPTRRPTATATTTATGTATATPTPRVPMVTALVALNVRSGPGTEYPRIGALAQGESARIAGRSPDLNWWRIVYPPNSNGRGWVSARAQYSSAVNAEAVPIVKPPPAPAPTPTATPTPRLEPPVIFGFWADRYVINQGETVTLQWDLANAQAAYLRYDSVETGVVAPGRKRVTPQRTTVYTLWAYNAVGKTERQLTIVVNLPTAPVIVLDLTAAAPWATWTSGAGTLPFGADADPRGFAVWRDKPVLEDKSRPARVLETHPQFVDDGNIVGTFSLIRPIQPGDRFKARVGFLEGAHGEVDFVVAALGGTLPDPRVMVTVHDKATDDKTRGIDVDLSSAAGATNIALGVLAGASSAEDWAVWVDPRVEH